MDGVNNLVMAGRQREADIVVYGHTHSVNHQESPTIMIINPGSLAGIRSHVRTYGMLQIEDGKVQVEFESF